MSRFCSTYGPYSYSLLILLIKILLRIFQRFRLVKFIEIFKTRVKNLKIEKITAFDKYFHELFFAFYFHLSKNLFLSLKNNAVADLTHFSTKCGCFLKFLKITKRWIVVKLVYVVFKTPVCSRNRTFAPRPISDAINHNSPGEPFFSKLP